MNKKDLRDLNIEVLVSSGEETKIFYNTEVLASDILMNVLDNCSENYNLPDENFIKAGEYLGKKVIKSYCKYFDKIVNENYEDFNSGGIFILNDSELNKMKRFIKYEKFIKYIHNRGYYYRVDYDKSGYVNRIEVNGKYKK